MKRRDIREAAFYLLFEKLFSDDTADMIIETAYEADNFELTDDTVNIFRNVSSNSDEFDGIIARFSETRQLSRIPKISIAILRLALYEIIYDDKVPANVAINEAVILSKKFAFDSDVQFINGVLGEFVRNMESDK